MGDRVDELRTDVFHAIEKTEEKILKVHRRVFENNGEESIISTLLSHDEDIRNARVEAGDAVIKATQALKYCKEDCVINEFVVTLNALKRTWKVIVFVSITLFLVVFGLSAWNGWNIHTQMKQVAKEYSELKDILINK